MPKGLASLIVQSQSWCSAGEWQILWQDEHNRACCIKQYSHAAFTKIIVLNWHFLSTTQHKWHLTSHGACAGVFHHMYVKIWAKGRGRGWPVVRFPVASFNTDFILIENYLLSTDQLMRLCFQWFYNLYWTCWCRKNCINSDFFATYIISNIK